MLAWGYPLLLAHPLATLAQLKDTGDGLSLCKEFSAAATTTRRRPYSPCHGIANLAFFGRWLLYICVKFQAAGLRRARAM